jgi:competence protein ComEC
MRCGSAGGSPILAEPHALIADMPLFIVSFVIGVCLVHTAAELLDLALLPVLAGVGVSMALAGAIFAKSALVIRRFVGLFCLLLAGAVLGVGYATWRADSALADALPQALEGSDIRLTGVVSSLPMRAENSLRFDFDVEQADAIVPQRIRLSWYANARKDEPLPDVHAGERWRLTVRLKRPHGHVNPDGFDYEAHLLERGVRATGYVRPDAVRLDALADGWRAALVQQREAIRTRIALAVPGATEPSRAQGILVALAVGDQASVAQADWDVFARTGITHLMSISGLHVTMLAALAYAVIAALWRVCVRRGGVLMRVLMRWPLQPIASVVALAVALAYTALAGFGVPAQRTVIMLGVLTLALGLRRNVGFLPGLMLALWVVVLVDPWAVLSAGFWLSFCAVGVLLWTARPNPKPSASSASSASSATVDSAPTGLTALRGRIQRGVIAWLWAQGWIFIAMLPILLALFGQVSVISPVVNAVAIPLISFVVTPLTLAGVLSGIDPLLIFAAGLLELTLPWLDAIAAQPGVVWQQAAPPAWSVALALLGIVGVLWRVPANAAARWAVWRIVRVFVMLIALLPMLLWQPERPQPGAALVRVLDVGQGLAVHVQTATQDVLFDTGPGYSAESDAGSRVIVPYLRAQGVAQLRSLVISHADNDHAGGAMSIVRSLPVEQVIHALGPDEGRVLGELRLPRMPCLSGQSFVLDGVQFDFLFPTAVAEATQNRVTQKRATNKYETNKRSTNAHACVLRVQAGERTLLMPSDIELAQEQWLVEHERSRLRSEVLIAPHHGSKTSSSEGFLDAVDPQLLIYPVGYRNRYRHPAPEVDARYVQRNVQRLRTDLDGAITVHLRPDGIAWEREREKSPRYWHGR